MDARADTFSAPFTAGAHFLFVCLGARAFLADFAISYYAGKSLHIYF